MVKAGVADMDGVIVVPSGDFILSASTFPEYFIKIVDDDIVMNVDYDITLFAECIAQPLHITHRFVGEERSDMCTAEYNKSMHRILPQYGIECVEIPRTSGAEGVISASTVRKLIDAKEFGRLKNYLPQSTMHYLGLDENLALMESFREKMIKLKQMSQLAHVKSFLPFITARLDILLISSAFPPADIRFTHVSDTECKIKKPDWFQKKGCGYVLYSYVGALELRFVPQAGGQLEIYLRGMDIRDEEDKSERIPYWIDYTSLHVNGREVFSSPWPAWHRKPYKHSFDVSADEEVSLVITWLPHRSE